ncbi:hypothetical protein GCM10020216_089140 [Nonomuraea helvata]
MKGRAWAPGAGAVGVRPARSGATEPGRRAGQPPALDEPDIRETASSRRAREFDGERRKLHKNGEPWRRPRAAIEMAGIPYSWGHGRRIGGENTFGVVGEPDVRGGSSTGGPGDLVFYDGRERPRPRAQVILQ